jgi:hypothetical protein
MKVNGDWIKCGFKDPKVQVGYEVQFDVNSGTYGMETKAVIVLSKGGSAGAGAVPSVTSSSPAVTRTSGYSPKEKVFPIPPLHGDRSIVRQNALARATDLIIASAGGKTFAVEFDSTSETVIRLARKFEAYTAGDLDLAEAKAEVASEGEAAAE